MAPNARGILPSLQPTARTFVFNGRYNATQWTLVMRLAHRDHPGFGAANRSPLPGSHSFALGSLGSPVARILPRNAPSWLGPSAERLKPLYLARLRQQANFGPGTRPCAASREGAADRAAWSESGRCLDQASFASLQPGKLHHAGCVPGEQLQTWRREGIDALLAPGPPRGSG